MIRGAVSNELLKGQTDPKGRFEVVVATRTSVSAKRDSRLALTQGPTSHLRPARAGLQRRHLLRILMP